MKTKFSGILTLFLAFVVQFTFAQEKTISGKVTDASGLPIPGVNIIQKGTTNGTQSDFDGNYSITAAVGDVLVFSYLGLKSQEITVSESNTISVTMIEDVGVLDEVVVTALGIKREAKTLPYAAQEVKQEDLNITQDANIKTAIAGKVAGVQIQGQAGSKLGQFGKIRIRGAISLTSDNDALYVVDGVPTDPNNVDMENVASVNILKGPNATALYGQRADAGVVVITTKKGKQGNVAVEVLSSVTFENVGTLPKQQNLYGGGYEGEDSFGIFGDELPLSFYPDIWQQFAGKRYIIWDNNYADESWGPKFDGQDYVPWYAWWPDSPYYGQTAKYVAQPNNIKDFYNTGTSIKNSVSVSGGSENFNARLSFSNLDQTGITPSTKLSKQFINTNFEFNITDKFKATAGINFVTTKINGEYSDGYGNQTSGAFNSWYVRNLDTKILRELKDLKTPDGYSASWNWWGPDYYAYFGGSFKKAAFWFNPYFFQENYERTTRTNNYFGNLSLSYQFNEHLNLSATAARDNSVYNRVFKVPYVISYSSAPDLYNSWSNSFGTYKSDSASNNYSATLSYENEFGDFDVSAFVGGNLRYDLYSRLNADMSAGAKTGGLIIPDVFTFSNAGIIPTPSYAESKKEVRSLFGKVSIGYKDFAYLDATYRKDWSSALPGNSNGYGYPSVGGTLIFSEFLNDNSILSFGKLRAGWAQVGNDVSAQLILPNYPLSGKPYEGIALMYTQSQLIDPNIKPALNTSYEFGFDTKFLSNRLGLSFTYYHETRKDEIIPISIPTATGHSSYLTNAGEALRTGIEVTFSATPIETDNFSWDLTFNYANNETTIESLPGDLQSLAAPGGSGAFGFATMIHELGSKWGQIRGTAITRDANGTPIINTNGTYATTQGQFLGSVLPDFTGGVLNTFRYKDFSLTASIDFQKGGKFFSLTEQWGGYSGLLEETAAINDKGSNVRDDVDAGGGVHVTGVFANGTTADLYVPATRYFGQFYGNRLAEPFVHNASYIKLRDISLTYTLPNKLFNTFGGSISVVGRNVWLISVAKDNVHKWDPSELSQTYGEDGQLPSTRSYGLNVKLTF